MNAQTAEIHLLLTAVHEVTSYNGNAETRSQHLADWAQLWAEDAPFTINNTGGWPRRLGHRHLGGADDPRLTQFRHHAGVHGKGGVAGCLRWDRVEGFK